MSDYLLNQLKQLASQNVAYAKIDQTFQKQANKQLFQNHTWIDLKFVLTHDDVTNQKQMLQKCYIK